MNHEEIGHQIIQPETGKPIRLWIKGVPMEEEARTQLIKVAQLPFIHKWVSVMPDVHVGKGATIGSVIPTKSAIIPAAVGVDIGCGMMAVKTSLSANDLPDDLFEIRCEMESLIPHGRAFNHNSKDTGAWENPPKIVDQAWRELVSDFNIICEKHKVIKESNNYHHLGTLGTGNHFVELCLDESNQVWIMLHSGSRGVGNRIGTYFIELAKQEMERWFIHLPDKNLAYFPEGTEYFNDYWFAVGWAQRYAQLNREVMMQHAIIALRRIITKPFEAHLEAINCHHNYVALENHYGKNVYVTRKGAVRARLGDLGIIPGSMGAKSFIVRGKGNQESFCSCSHGAGRIMSRSEAKRRFTIQDQIEQTKGVECRKDADVIDEIPKAYKNIDAVMHAQSDLVEIVHTLKQIVCIKG